MFRVEFSLLEVRKLESCACLLQQIQLVYDISVLYNYTILYSIEISRSDIYWFVRRWHSLKFSFVCTSSIEEYNYKVTFWQLSVLALYANQETLQNPLKNCLNPSCPFPASGQIVFNR